MEMEDVARLRARADMDVFAKVDECGRKEAKRR